MDLTGARVLLVEDDAMIAQLMTDFLEELGCVVVAVATRLDQAMEQARTLTLDLALLDVNLAGQVTYDAADLLRARGVKLVFATGDAAATLPAKLRDVPVLSKPFRLEQLARALRKAQRG